MNRYKNGQVIDKSSMLAVAVVPIRRIYGEQDSFGFTDGVQRLVS